MPKDVVRLLRKEAVNKITAIEHKIDNLKQKIESANSEQDRTYQIHINKLEFTKIGLLCQLDETKPKTLSEWNAFKVKFKCELKSFEDELVDLPEPVKNYIRFTSSVGKPKVNNVKLEFVGKIRKDE